MEKTLSLTLNKFEDGTCEIFLIGDASDSGICVRGTNPEAAVKEIAPYIEDYFYENTDD